MPVPVTLTLDNGDEVCLLAPCLISRKKIRKGEEVLLTYGEQYFDDATAKRNWVEADRAAAPPAVASTIPCDFHWSQSLCTQFGLSSEQSIYFALLFFPLDPDTFRIDKALRKSTSRGARALREFRTEWVRAESQRLVKEHNQYVREGSEAVSKEVEKNAAELAATIGNGVLVHEVPGLGWGLFADREFQSGALITLYDGDCLTRAEACGRDIQTHMTYKAGFFVDGYPVASSFRRDPLRVLGRGGGCFANHANTAAANAETFLYWRAGTGMNCIFLRVKRGRTVAQGDEITMCYGAPHSMSYRVAMGTAKFETSAASQVEKVSNFDGLSSRTTRQSTTESRVGAKIHFAPKPVVFTAKLTTWAVDAVDWKESRRGYGISCQDYPTRTKAAERREDLVEVARLAHATEESLQLLAATAKHELVNDHVDTDSETEAAAMTMQELEDLMQTEEGRAQIAAKNKALHRGCASVEQRVREGTLEWLGTEWSVAGKRRGRLLMQEERQRRSSGGGRADVKAKVKAACEAEAKAKAEAEANTKAEAEAPAKAQAQANAKAKVEAQAKARVEAQVKEAKCTAATGTEGVGAPPVGAGMPPEGAGGAETATGTEGVPGARPVGAGTPPEVAGAESSDGLWLRLTLSDGTTKVFPKGYNTVLPIKWSVTEKIGAPVACALPLV